MSATQTLLPRVKEGDWKSDEGEKQHSFSGWKRLGRGEECTPHLSYGHPLPQGERNAYDPSPLMGEGDWKSDEGERAF